MIQLNFRDDIPTVTSEKCVTNPHGSLLGSLFFPLTFWNASYPLQHPMPAAVATTVAPAGHLMRGFPCGSCRTSKSLLYVINCGWKIIYKSRVFMGELSKKMRDLVGDCLLLCVDCWSQWIGLRENLQETMDFPMKYGVFL